MQPTRAAATCLLTAVLAAAGASPAPAQTAGDIMNTALEQHEERMEGVETYSVTQSVMGFTTTNRFVKKEVDGHPVFVQAGRESGESAVPEGWGNPYRLLPRLADRASLEGRTRVDGEEVWHVSVDDFEGLELGQLTPEDATGQFRPRHMELFLDTETSVLRRLELRGEMVTDTSSRPMRMDASFHDYRDVEGMLHPFRVAISVQGMDAAISDEQLRQARSQLRQFQQQMEEMPESQQEAMKQMLEDQLDRLREIVESGNLDVEVRVQRVRVNEEVGGPEG